MFLEMILALRIAIDSHKLFLALIYILSLRIIFSNSIYESKLLLTTQDCAQSIYFIVQFLPDIYTNVLILNTNNLKNFCFDVCVQYNKIGQDIFERTINFRSISI